MSMILNENGENCERFLKDIDSIFQISFSFNMYDYEMLLKSGQLKNDRFLKIAICN